MTRSKLMLLAFIVLLPLMAHADPISIAIVTALGIEAGTTTAMIVGTIITAALTTALGAATRMLMPRPDMRTRVTVREALSPRRTLYGFYHGPGIVVHLFSDGDSGWLDEVHVFAAHECERIGDLYLDKVPVHVRSDSSAFGGSDGGYGNVTGLGSDTIYRGRVYYKHKRGDASDLVDGTAGTIYAGRTAFWFQSANTEWTADCKLTGCASIAVSLKRSDHFNGLPSVSIDLWGKRIYDPRDLSQSPTDSSTWKWADNAALCYLDYLITPRLDGGFGATMAEIDLDLFTAAANLCDELVAVLPASTTAYLAQATATAGQYQLLLTDPRGFYTGQTVTVGGISTTATEVKGNLMLVSVSPAPTTGVVVTAVTGAQERRYRTNGYFSWDMQPAEIMMQLLSSMGGIPTYINGLYGVYAAAWRPPLATLTDADCRGTLKVQALRSARDLANGVRCTFLNNFAGAWQPDDVPPVIHRLDSTNPDTSANNDYYLRQDGGYRRWKDVQLPFVVSPSQAQRLARIVLEQNRRQVSVQWPGKMSCYQLVPPDTVMISRARFEWNSKTFQVMDTRLTIERDHNDAPFLATELQLQETDPGVYDFDGEQPFGPRIANLPPAPDSLPPEVQGLALSTYDI